jgi:response regulator RpfG family c-di-GMP phosphodiesterase
MREDREVAFDPVVFDAFMRIEEQIIGISEKYRDTKIRTDK